MLTPFLSLSATSITLDPNFGEKLATALKEAATSQLSGYEERMIEYEKVAQNLSYGFGQSKAFAQEIQNSIAGAENSVTLMGGQFADLYNIQSAAMDGLGSTVVLTSDVMTELYAAARATEGSTDLTKENFRQLMETFTKAGDSVYNIGARVNTIMNEAKEAGANAKKVFDEVEANISSLNLFNFSNGVEGMAKMASTSQMLRVSMKETLAFAENLYDPSKATEIANVFQRYGMGNLTNIYELQDLARNAPEKLQEKLAESFAGLTIFDPAQNRQIMTGHGMEVARELSKSIPGLTTDFIVNAGLAMGDMQQKMNKVILPDWAKSDETKNFLLRQAQLGSGENANKYGVSIGGQFRELQTLSQEESEQYKATVEAQQQPNNDIISATQNNINGMVLLTNAIKSLQSFYPRMLAANRKVADGLDFVGQNLLKGMDKKGGMFDMFGINVQTRPGGGRTYDATQFRKEFNEGAEKLFQKFITELPNTMAKLPSLMADITSNDPTRMAAAAAEMKNMFSLAGSDILKTMFPALGNPTQFKDDVVNAITLPFTNLGSAYAANPSLAVQSSAVRSAALQTKVTPSTPTTATSPAFTTSSNLTGTPPQIQLVQPSPWQVNINATGPTLTKLEDILKPPFIDELTRELKPKLDAMTSNNRLLVLQTP